MKYERIEMGRFLERPNRFIAHVEILGKKEIVHVKNTGRCAELLVPGTTVYVQKSDNLERKTQWDLIGVEKGNRMINMDSQIPNYAVKQWLSAGNLGELHRIKPETVFGASRFDFSFEKDGKLSFLEVKGVTLENDGICAFPDAPTQRGARHLRELAKLCQEGYGAYVLFVIQMENVKYLHPNDSTDPVFGQALRDAAKAGMQILACDCKVTPDSMTIHSPVEIRL